MKSVVPTTNLTDSKQIKETLDSSIFSILEESGYEASLSTNNLQLIFGILACLSTGLSYYLNDKLICYFFCGCFFFFNSILTLFGYLFKNNVLISKNLKFESFMKKYSLEYEIKLHFLSKDLFFLFKEIQKGENVITKKIDVQNYFDINGKVDRTKLNNLIEQLLNEFEKNKKNI